HYRAEKGEPDDGGDEGLCGGSVDELAPEPASSVLGGAAPRGLDTNRGGAGGAPDGANEPDAEQDPGEPQVEQVLGGDDRREVADRESSRDTAQARGTEELWKDAFGLSDGEVAIGEVPEL